MSVSHSALKGKKLTAGLPNIHLQDIGKDKNGASAGEVAEKIMTSIKSGVSSVADVLNLDKLTGVITDKVAGAKQAASQGTARLVEKTKKTGSAVKEGFGKAGDKLKGLFH
ncbi:MAG: hypothetical protein ACE5GZ_13430 [Gammaproteobacteria bacterium]